jgi:putative flippase GtrA
VPPQATAAPLDDQHRPTGRELVPVPVARRRGLARPRRLPTGEVLTFLAVGGAGYVTDVVAFNWLRDHAPVGGHDPVIAKAAAVAVAMVVTYLGNRLLTWRDVTSDNRRREVALFVVFNLLGLMISVVLLAVSHDVMGLTSRLADNLVGNVLGVGLGTAFRYWAYRRFVFVSPSRAAVDAPPAADESPRDPLTLVARGQGQRAEPRRSARR